MGIGENFFWDLSLTHHDKDEDISRELFEGHFMFFLVFCFCMGRNHLPVG